MRTAGVRDARQNLTSLLDEVRKGRELVSTERGRPVARLVPFKAEDTFPDLSRIRQRGRTVHPSLSEAVLDREDRG